MDTPVDSIMGPNISNQINKLAQQIRKAAETLKADDAVGMTKFNNLINQYNVFVNLQSATMQLMKNLCIKIADRIA